MNAQTATDDRIAELVDTAARAEHKLRELDAQIKALHAAAESLNEYRSRLRQEAQAARDESRDLAQEPVRVAAADRDFRDPLGRAPGDVLISLRNQEYRVEAIVESRRRPDHAAYIVRRLSNGLSDRNLATIDSDSFQRN